jgi:hypothetical protein
MNSSGSSVSATASSVSDSFIANLFVRFVDTDLPAQQLLLSSSSEPLRLYFS